MTPWLVFLLSLATQACVASVTDLSSHDLGAACVTPACLSIAPKVKEVCLAYSDALEERVTTCNVDFPVWVELRAHWRENCSNPRLRMTSDMTAACPGEMAAASCVDFTVVLNECDALWYFAPFI